MNLRYLVPALGLAALSTTSAFAEDKAPMVTFGGWVDAVLQYGDPRQDGSTASDETLDNAFTGKDESAGSLRFTGAASIKTMVKVTDTLEAKINLWFDPGSSSTNLNMREAYFNWGFSEGLSWQMGKYIDHLGWIAAEPTGPTFLFINADTIGYRQAYGNDVLGTALNIAPKDSPISASVHVTNGYYTTADATSTNYTSTPSTSRENNDLGFGLDLTFALPEKMGSINAELAYDIHSGSTAYLGGPAVAAANLGGDVLLAGINATLKPVSILTLGAEFMYLTVGESENFNGVSQNDGIDRMQGLLLANVAIEKAPVPMSVSALFQFVSIDHDAVALTETEERMYVGVALLTNPLTTTNFGLNFEVGFFDESGMGGSTGTGHEEDGVTVAVEGLVAF